jgi:hypothetical protein
MNWAQLGSAATTALLICCAACVFEFGTGGHLSQALEFAPGPLARAANSLSTGVEDARESVRIDAVSPASGPVGTEVVLTGFGFTDDNTIHFGAGVVAHVSIRSAIGIACTTNPSCRGGIQQSLVFAVPDALPGANRVWVENRNGRSRSLRFHVTG